MNPTPPTSLDLAKNTLWSQITKGYPKDPTTRRTTYTVDEHNAPVLAELAHYLVGAPCKWASPGAGIILAGGVGTGKTDLMRALSRTITAGGGEGHEVISAVELVALHDRSSRDERDNGGARVILQYGNRAADLCLDDLGEEPEGRHYGATRDVLAEVVALRYNLWKRRGILTHYTTNILADEALLKRYGQRTTDRILEMARVVPLAGPSRRVASLPQSHDRPVLFELPPPMPTPEEQEAQRQRSAEQFRRLRQLVEGAAKELHTRGKVVPMNPGLTQGEHLAAFVASLGDMTHHELTAYRDRLEATESPAAAAPYLQAIGMELDRHAAKYHNA